jgi:raffinose/stachyose/melibiose transport system substrate-binding protein
MKRTTKFAAATLTLAALTIYGLPSSSAADAITLTVQTDSYSLPGFQVTADEFQKENPGVTVSFQTLTADQQSTTNLQVLTSADAPDVASAPTNTTVYTEMIKNHQFLPLDDVWAAANLVKGYGPAIAPTLKAADGHPYSVLYSVVLYGVAWYNKDVFKKAGIKVPANHQIGSMAVLKDWTKKLRAKGYQPMSVGGSSGYHLTWMLDNLLATSAPAAKLTNFVTNFDPKVPVTVSYTDKTFLAALQRLKDMYDAKFFQNGVLGMDQNAGLALFASGMAGMMMGHNLTPAALKDRMRVNLNLSYLFLPQVNPKVRPLPEFYAGNTLEVPVNAKNPALAKKFLTLLMSPKMQAAAIAATSGAAPAVAVPASELTSGGLPPELELFKYASAYGTASGWGSLVPASLGGVTDPMIEKLFVGKMTTLQIGKALDALLVKVRAGKL